jgi:hypothetical protein
MRMWWTQAGVPMLAVLTVLAGCGELVNGPTQQVKISTIPPGAMLTVDGRELASPARVELERQRHHTVAATLPGFEPAHAEINSSFDSAVVWGNCLLFLCLPQIWEGGRPSQHRLDPEDLEMTLNPIGWSPR